MEYYVGLDVSLKLTAVCIVDRIGAIKREAMLPSDPETIAAFIKGHATNVVRIGFESGATSTWLWTERDRMGLPVVCIDARHAKAALKMQINKSDRNDAAGIHIAYPQLDVHVSNEEYGDAGSAGKATSGGLAGEPA